MREVRYLLVETDQEGYCAREDAIRRMGLTDEILSEVYGEPVPWLTIKVHKPDGSHDFALQQGCRIYDMQEGWKVEPLLEPQKRFITLVAEWTRVQHNPETGVKELVSAKPSEEAFMKLCPMAKRLIDADLHQMMFPSFAADPNFQKALQLASQNSETGNG